MKAVVLAAVAAISCGLAPQVLAQDSREETVGAWKLTSIVDPITDQGRMIATVEAAGGLLAIKCDDPGRDSVYVHWISTEYLGGNYDRRRTTLRFDQDAPTTETWTYNGRSAVQTGNREAVAFARRLRTANRVVLRGSDYEGRERTAVFELAPADTEIAMQRVFQACQGGGV